MNHFRLFLLSSLLIFHFVAVEVNGFSMKIIHRDSPESPLYPGNLTLQQKLVRLHGQIVSYMPSTIESGMTNQSESVDPKSVRAPLSQIRAYYMAVVGLGTFDPPETQYMNAYLVVDTGSDIIWTQCENCRDCFPQTSPLYPYSHSKSFKNLRCDDHPLCFPGKCIDGKCTYRQNYAGKAVGAGYLASEIFIFNSDNGGTESVGDIVFGCGFEQREFAFGRFQDNPVTGILGLGYGSRSLLTQLSESESANGLMSYCIPHWKVGPAVSTFLKFGADAQFRPGATFVTTPLIRGPIYEYYYYVELLDISVQGRHLNYPPGTFAMTPDGGGCFLDTGSPLILIKRDAYTALKNAVLYYFEPLGIPPESVYGFDLCYLRRGRVSTLPTITFHFRNADFHVSEGAFFTAGDHLCMAIGPHDYPFFSIVIGNLAQSNYRILYCLAEITVSFGKEECNTGS